MKNRIREWSGELGFEACGFAAVDAEHPDSGRLAEWLKAGCAGEMAYMHRNNDVRYNPTLLLPDAKTMIMVLMNYYPRQWQPEGQPRIASYAYGCDYHYIVKSRLRALAERIAETEAHEYVVFADSAPVLERFWAERAGLGWIGRSGMLVNPRLGTYTLIGTLITTLVLPPDSPMPNCCGRCRRCVSACPTCAFIADGVIDARRCLSYQTIEKRGAVDGELLPLAGNTLYGCDRCMSICPWNRFAHPTDVVELQPVDGLFDADWQNLTRGEFNRMLRHNAMQRAGYRKLRARLDEIFSKTE